MAERFEEMLSGGHPNSLGRTVEVVERVLDDRSRASELFDCYESPDEVVRLRTSNAWKRLSLEAPELVMEFVDRFLSRITRLDQASAQWTLSDLFRNLGDRLSADQRELAAVHMKRNLRQHDDWIVLNSTMKTLGEWAAGDIALRKWLIPELQERSTDARKSVAGTARRMLAALE